MLGAVHLTYFSVNAYDTNWKVIFQVDREISSRFAKGWAFCRVEWVLAADQTVRH